MTAHTPRILTEGEQGLVDAFENAGLGSDANRQAAIDALKATGLPTRRVEAFHYTDLRALLSGKFTTSTKPSESDAESRASGYMRMVHATRIPIMDGHVFEHLGDDLPAGVTLTTGAAPSASDVSDIDNAVVTLSSAFATDGVTIKVDDNTALETPIGLANTFGGATGGMAVTRSSVVVGANANVSFVDRCVGPNSTPYLRNQVTSLDLAEGADVTWIIANEEGDAASRLARMSVTLAKDSKLTMFLLNAGGALVRQELMFDVVGEGADLNISGVNLVGGDVHIDVTSAITHKVPNTTATETFRNVATGRGNGVFQGRINVAQPAQLTDARMACNTLLLSDDCGFSAKPELEIFADDVQCAHGATVTDLEEDYLFYLRARGISERDARRLLIRAFVAEVIEELENEELIEALEVRLDSWMEQHV